MDACCTALHVELRRWELDMWLKLHGAPQPAALGSLPPQEVTRGKAGIEHAYQLTGRRWNI